MEKDFGIVFCSKGRPLYLIKTIECIVENCNNIDNISILVNIDDDDFKSKETCEYLKSNYHCFDYIETKFSGNIHIHVNQLINILIKKYNIKYCWGLGDDCWIQTPNFDIIAKTKFEEYLQNKSDRIAIGLIESNSVDKNINTKIGYYSDAPMMTSEGVKALGFFMPEHWISLGADVHINAVFKAVDRTIDMREIWFDHSTHNTIEKVINPDNTAVEYRARQYQRQSVDPFNYDYSDDIAKLKNKIKL